MSSLLGHLNILAPELNYINCTSESPSDTSLTTPIHQLLSMMQATNFPIKSNCNSLAPISKLHLIGQSS